jgi:hypothetical protein
MSSSYKGAGNWRARMIRRWLEKERGLSLRDRDRDRERKRE